MSQHPRLSRASIARKTHYRARAECEGRMVRDERRGSAGARVPARDRSSTWETVHQAHQRVETGFDQTKSSQAGEGGRVGVVAGVQRGAARLGGEAAARRTECA